MGDEEEEEKGDVDGDVGDDIIDEEPVGEPRYRKESLRSRDRSFTCRPISDWLQLLKHSRSWRSRFDENDDVDEKGDEEKDEKGREEWAGGEAASCRIRIGIRSGNGRDDEMADFIHGLESS